MNNLPTLVYLAILLAILVLGITIYVLRKASKQPTPTTKQSLRHRGHLLQASEDVLEREGYMTWEEYTARAIKLSELVEAAAIDKYVDFIIGISGGGLIVAELISKNLEESIPLLLLYSKRKANSQANFSNDENKAMTAYLRRYQHNLKRPLGIVLVDHRVVTGDTAVRAIHFLEKELGKRNVEILFAPLLAKNPDPLRRLMAYLPSTILTNISESDYFKSLSTTSDHLPYQLSKIEDHRAHIPDSLKNISAQAF